MSRLQQAFARARGEGRAALVVYLTAFDPDRDGSLARLLAAAEAGADVIELGVPFSDPTADGPVIQAAMVRALAAGASLGGVLELCARLRERVHTPVVLFSYANPLLRLGEEVGARLAQAGVDGVLCLDMPPKHAGPLRDPVRAAGLDWIGLVGPRSTPARTRRVCEGASGFIYQVGMAGVTGGQVRVGDDLAARVAAVRQHTELPVALGFGVRTPADAAAVARLADGVVVGSALVEAARAGPDALARDVAALAAALDRSGGAAPEGGA